eukprot:2428493-Prymnesium_polylepis.1
MLALLLASVDMRVADLNQWARVEALVEERRVQELGSAWKPAEPAAWNTQAGTKVGTSHHAPAGGARAAAAHAGHARE